MYLHKGQHQGGTNLEIPRIESEMFFNVFHFASTLCPYVFFVFVVMLVHTIGSTHGPLKP